jgi:CelD/BcsL family acetyltransferase involved in cellulose biosynthesis
MKAGSRGDLQVSTVTGRAGLEALAAEWRELALACRTATVFQTYEWNVAWWRYFGRGRRLRVVTFRRGDRLIGLAPLMTGPWYLTPIRKLSFVGTGASDYLDIIAAQGEEKAVADALYTYLRAWPGWDIADLQQMRDGGLLRECPPTSVFSYDAIQEPCPYLPLASTWQEVLGGFGKKTRYNIGYYSRSLEKTHDVEFGWAGEDDLDDEMSNLFELHQRRWNKRWLPGVFGSAKVQRFHRTVARDLLRRGWLRLFYLRLDGNTEACLYCFSYGDRICYYQGGFEPTLAKLSLGTVLTARAIETAVDEGKHVFDFLRGDEPYKAKWTGQSVRNARRLMARSRALAPLVRMVQRVEDAVETRAKEFARKLK